MLLKPVIKLAREGFSVSQDLGTVFILYIKYKNHHLHQRV